jgi:hypothetical protein
MSDHQKSPAAVVVAAVVAVILSAQSLVVTIERIDAELSYTQLYSSCSGSSFQCKAWYCAEQSYVLYECACHLHKTLHFALVCA